jgi:hypothetical protein
MVRALFGLAFNFFKEILLFSTLSANLASEGVRNSKELPLDLYLAVLPTL